MVTYKKAGGFLCFEEYLLPFYILNLILFVDNTKGGIC